MERLGRALREPKWIAVGLTLAVLAGSTIKLLAKLTEDPTTAAGTPPAAAIRGIDVEPGRYEILASSWASDAASELGTDRRPPVAEPAEVVQEPLQSPGRQAFFRNARKRWNGICVAVEGR